MRGDDLTFQAVNIGIQFFLPQQNKKERKLKNYFISLTRWQKFVATNSKNRTKQSIMELALRTHGKEEMLS